MVGIFEKESTTIIFDMTGSSGGLTFAYAISKNFREDQCISYGDSGNLSNEFVHSMDKDSRKKILFCYGHNVHHFNELTDNKCHRITMIRNPANVCISYFIYCSDYNGIYFHPTGEPPPPQGDIEGTLKWMERIMDGARSNGPQPNYAAKYILSLFGDTFRSDDELFEKALRRLKNDYALVGITELFEESQFLLNALFPWINVKIWKRVRVNKTPWDELDVDPALLARCADFNPVDTELYTIMRQRLEDEIPSITASDVYLDHKAKCISNDTKMVRHLLVGSKTYLPPMTPEIYFDLCTRTSANLISRITAEDNEMIYKKRMDIYLDRIAELEDKIMYLASST